MVGKITAAGYNAETIKPFLAKYGIEALPQIAAQPGQWQNLLTDMGIQ
jgi:hypothetical protein